MVSSDLLSYLTSPLVTSPLLYLALLSSLLLVSDPLVTEGAQGYMDGSHNGASCTLREGGGFGQRETRRDEGKFCGGDKATGEGTGEMENEG
jgi:hypothetical protein